MSSFEQRPARKKVSLRDHAVWQAAADVANHGFKIAATLPEGGLRSEIERRSAILPAAVAEEVARRDSDELTGAGNFLLPHLRALQSGLLLADRMGNEPEGLQEALDGIETLGADLEKLRQRPDREGGYQGRGGDDRPPRRDFGDRPRYGGGGGGGYQGNREGGGGYQGNRDREGGGGGGYQGNREGGSTGGYQGNREGGGGYQGNREGGSTGGYQGNREGGGGYQGNREGGDRPPFRRSFGGGGSTGGSRPPFKKRY